MEIDDFRVSSYLLENLLTDINFSTLFKIYLDKQSFQYDYLLGNIWMEKYLVTKSKCSACITPQDRRLIYRIEQATYTNYKEYKALVPSHSNCVIIQNYQQLKDINGPPLTFDMMLKLHKCNDLQQQYRLFRYYYSIIEDSMAIELYLEEYKALEIQNLTLNQDALDDQTQSTEESHTYTTTTLSNFEKCEESVIMEIEATPHDHIYQSDVSFNHGSQTHLNANECTMIYNAPALGMENTNALVKPTLSPVKAGDISALDVDVENVLRGGTKPFNINGDLQRIRQPVKLEHTIRITNSYQFKTWENENVKKLYHTSNGPDTKSGDVGVWPKWPNITRKVTSVKHV